ncbi:gas vesicle protein [Actinomadura sp. GC306]|uniref:gas vesicle protein GvpG n=1 Tax=Actinomadura sp. GC306 TaxID=2530367 RepID=UPI001045C722|nr:gas vesicle protein GvpG [Actinomadura sp. GC306]TDC58826.1 gas vesicle protein [Actinomadura sp. GC306]
MGLFTGLVTLPLAPVRGVMWLAETLTEQAEARLYDPGRIAAEMQEIADQAAAGEITEEEAAEREEELIQRLNEGRAREQARLQGGG